MAANLHPTTSMIHLDTRLASYSASSSRPPSKSRSKKSQPHPNTTHDFPLNAETHPNLIPTSLSAAGFFFNPAEGDATDDTCQCFLCGLKLGGWDEGDDPFEEHVKRHNCPWAEFVCQARLNRRNGIRATYDTAESLPSSAESSEWREKTYQKWWPHKQKSAWLPTVKNLAKAGFVFYASSDSPDLVICPFCDYGVEGWEATDDPWAIHYKKSPLCEFFTAKIGESSEPQAAPAKAKTGGTRSKRGTTASKATSAAPESTAPSEDDAEDEKVYEAQATLGRSTSSKNPRQTKSRVTSRSRSKTRPIEERLESDAGASAIDEPEELKAAKPSKPRKTGKGKGKKKAEVAASEAESEVTSVVQDELDAPEEAAAKPAKGRRSRKQKAESVPVEEAVSDATGTDTQEPPPVTEKKRGRKKVPQEDAVDDEAVSAVGLGQPGTSARRHMTRSVSGRSAQSQQSGLDDGTEASDSALESDADMDLREVAIADVDVGISEAEAVDAERTIRAPSPPSKQSSNSNKSGKSAKSQTSESSLARSTKAQEPPRSQLDRFANIPPSSPFPTPRHRSQATSLQPPSHSPSEATPRPRSTLVSAKPSKASPHVQLPRETLNKSLVDGAREARKVMDDLVLNSTGEQDLQGLSEEQQGMTLEELVRWEMKKRYESLKLEGEEMIRKWEERGNEARRKIETM